MNKAEQERIGALNDKIKAWCVYLSCGLPLLGYVLIGFDAVILFWGIHFFWVLTLPRIKGPGTRWSFKRQLKWIGGSLLFPLVVYGAVIILDDSDEVFCDLAPAVSAELILRSNTESPRLLSEKISANELRGMIVKENNLTEFAASIESQPECIVGMSTEEAVKIAEIKPDFAGIVEDRDIETFSRVWSFFNENETGKYEVNLTLTYDGENNVFIDPSEEPGSFKVYGLSVINAIKLGAGDFLDLKVLDNAEISFVAELSVDGDYLVVSPVQSYRLMLSINGQLLEDWKKTNAEFLTAKAQETERLAEVARLAEIERKRAEAEFERSIPKMSASDLDYAYRNNEMRADAKYTNKIVQISGYVDSDGVSDGWLGLSVQLQAGYMSVSCHFDRTDANKARAMKLNYGSYVVIRGECQGTTLGTVQLYDCEFRN